MQLNTASKKKKKNTMNPYIKMQVNNIKSMVETFKQSCELAAKQDDGSISKEEQKILNQINKASISFLKDLEKIKFD